MSGRKSDHAWYILDVSRCLVLSAGFYLDQLERYKQALIEAGRTGELIISPTYAGCSFSSREVARRILSHVSTGRIIGQVTYISVSR